MTNTIKGTALAILSGASFGLIPLFTIPLMAVELSFESILAYRFMFAAMCIGLLLLWRHTSFRITFGDFWRISLLSLMYVVHGIMLFDSYNYISSGIATSLVFTSPVWCPLIGIFLLGERLSWLKTSCIALASVGVMLLTGALTDTQAFSEWGLLLGLSSGFLYGIYLTVIPRFRFSNMTPLKLTFYIFLFGMVYATLYGIVFHGGIDSVPDVESWVNLLLLGLIPTAFSNICLNMSLKLIDTTIVAILGAFEPVTAMLVGVVVLDEKCGVDTIIGVVLILVSVTILTAGKKIMSLIRK